MFNCGICNRNSEPGEKAFRVVIGTVEFLHPFRKDAHRYVVNGKKVTKDDPGGRGKQIVKEVLAHKNCAEKYHAT